MACRRQRKTEHGVTDFDALLEAIKSIKINGISIRKAAAANNIPQKSMCRYVKKFDERVDDINGYSDDQLLPILRGIASYENVGAAQQVCLLFA